MEGTDEILVYVHEGTVVLELPAVVGRSEHCYQFAFPAEFVALLDYLVGTTNQIDVELGQEGLDYVLPEGEAHSSFVFSPTWNVRVRIWPQ